MGTGSRYQFNGKYLKQKYCWWKMDEQKKGETVGDEWKLSEIKKKKKLVLAWRGIRDYSILIGFCEFSFLEAFSSSPLLPSNLHSFSYHIHPVEIQPWKEEGEKVSNSPICKSLFIEAQGLPFLIDQYQLVMPFERWSTLKTSVLWSERVSRVCLSDWKPKNASNKMFTWPIISKIIGKKFKNARFWKFYFILFINLYIFSKLNFNE